MKYAQIAFEKELAEFGIENSADKGVGEAGSEKGQWYRIKKGDSWNDVFLVSIDLEKERGIKIPKQDFGFELKENLWLGLVLFIDEVEPAVYLIPSSVFEEPNLIFDDNDCGEKFPHLSNWEVRVFSKGIELLRIHSISYFFT